MLRDGLPPVGLLLEQRGLTGNLLGDKDQEVIEQFPGLLRWKAASQPQDPQLRGAAQPVMRTATRGDLSLGSGGKPDAVGAEVAGRVHRMEHGQVLLRRAPLGHGYGAPGSADGLTAPGRHMREVMRLPTIEPGT
jgi:hypothetical protein